MKRSQRWPQHLRRLLQVLVLLFVLYAAAGGAWRNHKMGHNSARLVGLIHGETMGKLYALNEDVLQLFGESHQASLGMLGMPWAGRVFGVNTVDPLMAASHTLKTRSFSLSLWLGALLPALIALFLGKVFCSHLCPARLTFEVGQMVRKGLIYLGLEPLDWQPSPRLGGWVLLGGLLAAAFAGGTVWLFILPYVGLSVAIFAGVTGGAGLMVGIPLAIWLFVDVFISPGLWCRSLCPTGWWLEQVGRLSVLRLLKRGARACPSSCDLCQQACPYNLDPSERTHRPACDNCGVCVSVCPSDRLHRVATLSIGAPMIVAEKGE